MGKFEYRIVCSGKGKPWHLEGQNRTHVHPKTPENAVADVETLNAQEAKDLTPIAAECLPWVLQGREVEKWSEKAAERGMVLREKRKRNQHAQDG